MVKPNRKLSTSLVSRSNDTQNSLHNSPELVVDLDFSGEDTWTVVKKQKITVLIPPLATSEQCRVSNLDLSQGPLQKPLGVAETERNDGAVLFSSKRDCQSGRKDCTPSVANPGPAKMDLRLQNVKDQDSVQKTLSLKKTNLLKCHDRRNSQSGCKGRTSPVANRGLGKMDLRLQTCEDEVSVQKALCQKKTNLQKCNARRNSQSGCKGCTSPVANRGLGKMDIRLHNSGDQDDVLRPLCQKKTSLLKCHDRKLSKGFEQSRVDLPGCTTILNRKMRASNLEMKIVRAGGWRRWLSSMGLDQFERIFRGNSVHKFQLVNLSMNKLKDMGYHAVGPRRKLIHAIECLCWLGSTRF